MRSDERKRAMDAASVLRALAERARAGELEGKHAIPFLMGAAAALEAQAGTFDEDRALAEGRRDSS